MGLSWEGRFYSGNIVRVKGWNGSYAEVVHNGRTGFVDGQVHKEDMTMYQIIDVGLKFNGDRPNGGEQKAIDAVVIHHAAGNGSVEDIHKPAPANGGGALAITTTYARMARSTGADPKSLSAHTQGATSYNSHSIGIVRGQF